MADVAALQKYPCAACGAQAEWNPAKQALVCAFCGTVTPFSVDSAGQVRELDLAVALRDIPDEDRGWMAEKRTVQCQSCKAVSVFDPERVGQNCDFCGSPALVPYDEIKAPIRPESLLPFKVTDVQVREQIRRWYASKWLAPNALRRRALVDRVHGVYIPYWTFDAHVVCPWRAEAGHYYYTTESYRDNQGRNQTRQVRHVRWEPASGEVRHFFDDEPVPGTQGVSESLLRQVEPFPTGGARALQHRLSVGVRGRALPGGAARGRRSFAGADEEQALRHVRRSRCLATPSGTWRSSRRSPAGPSSTCSCPSGC